MKDGTTLPIVPRILRRELAALYVGIAPSTWDVEVKEGRAPRAVQVTAGVKGWDRHDLDLWIEGRKQEQPEPVNPWDEEPA